MNLTSDSSRVAVYHNEIHYLSKYLGDRELYIENHPYWFLKWRGSSQLLKRLKISKEKFEEASEESDEPFYEMCEKIRTSMTEQEKEDFVDFMAHEDPTEAPAWAHMSLERKRLPRDTWLIHFSDQTGKITGEGFTRGVGEMEQIALTTWLHENTKKYGGYNFAFIAGDRASLNVAQSEKYGSSAVMFQSSGLEVYHYGDDERQVIFWGKAIDPSTIVELVLGEERGEWRVAPRYKSSMSQKGRDYVYKGSFTDVIRWVENHHFQYRRQIMGR